MRITKSALALLFLGAGGMKLAGQRDLVEAFRQWGYPDWMRWATGIAEVSGASLLLAPKTTPAGAAQLALVMAGAIYTHVKTPGEAKMAVIPAGVLATLGWIAWEDCCGSS